YHWWRGEKKEVVEDCLTLDANRWTREGLLQAGVHQSGLRWWTFHGGSDFIVQYEVDALAVRGGRAGSVPAHRKAVLRLGLDGDAAEGVGGLLRSADHHPAALRGPALVVRLPAEHRRSALWPEGREVASTALREVFRLPSLLRLDVHQLSGEL